ncbi:MAG: protein kinase, partial [Candidatus Glassbacteria bacterium]
MAKAARPTPSIIGRRYIIHERLGTGGMGAVYRATDRLTGNQVALKSVTLPAEQLLFSSRAGSTDLHLALAQEFRTLASLRHPNIISVLDYGFDEKINPYFTMNFLENAQTILEAGRGASLTTQIGYLIQTLQALSYLHRRGVLHRDLKPENVLIVNGGVKVLDFGLSVHTELDRARVDDSMVGTVAYMAPEFVRDREVSKSTDLYSVGVVAYELLSGRHPFDTSDMAILFDEIMNKPAPVSSIGMEDELTEVLSRLLTKSPEERYWDANKVIRDICDATSRPLPPETVEIRESFLQAARFVGRDKELAQLKEALDAAIVGNGSTWLIGGESGVGKSRLTEELRTLALVKGALVLRGQAVSEGGSPYSLWRDIIKRLVITTELKEEEASVLKPYIPHISDLLGYAVADPPPLDPLATQHRLFKTIAEVLSRQCKLQPVVLILEDLQWIESNSLAILDRLSSQVPNSSLLIIGNYRDDERPHLPDELPGMERLKLKRLTDEGITELSSSMLGKAGCSKQVVSLLQRETEGNPFFLVETVHTLAEEAGQIDDIATMTLPEKVFSGGVQEVVQRRLNRVPSNARPLLQLAAVAGRELDLSVLRELAPEEDIDIWLTTGADSAVLEAQGEMWRFSHDKLRAGVLDALSDDTRPILHRSVAEAIEKVHPDSLEHVAALAFLWGVAGDYGKEFHYSKLAGEQAVTNSANVEAINYFKRALALIAILLKPPDRPQAELELQARLAVPLLAAKGWGSPELEGVVARARELCQQVGETPLLFHALFFTCAFYFSRAEFQTAKEIGEQLLTMAETSGDPGMVMAANWG